MTEHIDRDWTPGPWYPPHIGDKSIKCECKSILSEGYAGAIATIIVGNGKLISEGGNDAPPYDEAVANAHLIAASPDLYEALKHAVKIIREHIPPEALGIDGDGSEHLQRSWPILDEYLHNMDATLSKARNGGE